MKSVGIKQLKARLSEYVRMARGGETILVSDRDEIVAELGPARRQSPAPDSMDALLDRLAQGGQVTRAARGRSQRPWSPEIARAAEANRRPPARRAARGSVAARARIRQSTQVSASMTRFATSLGLPAGEGSRRRRSRVLRNRRRLAQKSPSKSRGFAELMSLLLFMDQTTLSACGDARPSNTS